ncbi:MAG: hypothetical protein R3362_05400, partial [Rhodothermales bacterium]|nr:hypothetical protein [Rhodothermales bacterium]
MKYPLLLLAALAFAPASLAQPCTTEWAAPTDGDWTEAANWTAGVPGADDTACILVPGTYTVSFSGTQGLQELRLGGTSGTQTLVVGGTFSPLGGGTVGPNGRITLTNSQACAACDGLPNVSDTLLVEGGVVLPSQVGLLTNGGTLDIAPGGVVTVTGGAMAGGAGALFRVRGTLEASGCGPPSGGNNCFVDAPVEVDGGTVQALGGVFRVRGGGTLGDASVHAAEGAFLWLTRSTGVDRYVVEGTLSGAPVGEVRLLSADLAAGPDDATLAVGGSGLLLQGSFAGTSYLTSAGGAFVNTGRLIQATNTFTGFRSVVLRNRGVMEEAFGFDLLDGALVRNEPEGVIRLANVGVEGNGRLENAGLIVSEGAGSSVGFGGLLWSEVGSEIRALDGPRITLEPPASRALPDGAALTGSGEVSLAGAFAYEGTVSPGTDDAPIATLSAFGTFRASSEGLPQLVIDLDAGGQSDRVDVIGANAGTVRAGGALVLRMRPGYTPAIGDEFTVLTSSFEVDGQFDVVAASGAPEGIAFVAETVAAGSGEAVTVRAVQAATDGPITVSETAPVGGAVRPIFLTGPGAGGVTAARLDCTTCLDPDAWGSIPATVTGTETFKEARFDLTSPRVFGLYDLVIQRPGLPDEVVPVTVRPYLSYVIAEQGLTVGARTRPPGFGYNVSRLQMEAHTNADEPAYHVPQVVRSTDLYALSLTLVNPFDGGLVSYGSDEALDPDRAPVVFGRLREGAATPLTIGLRISPEDVLFPEQTPTGPDDPRIPFGDPTQFSAAFGPIHLSSARTTTLIGEALRTSGHAGLSSYIASVDAADAEAAETAVRNTLLSTGGRYYTLAEELLGEIIEALDPIVSAPAGLAAAAGLDFEMALEAAAFAFADEVEAAHTEALMEAPPAVADLFSAEVAALFPDGPPGGGRLTRPAVLRSGQGRRPGSQRGDLVVQTRCDFQKNADTVGAILDDIE